MNQIKPLSVDLMMPVYNEEIDLPDNIRTLHEFLSLNLPAINWKIVIVDNGSNDNTLHLAEELSRSLDKVKVTCIDQKGRGRALRQTWSQSQADIVSYMDIDLSTDLNAFPLLIEAIQDKGYDIAIGSRLCKGSQVQRSVWREFLSRNYNLMHRVMLQSRFCDAQCGFKALSRKAADELLSLTSSNFWFFDTELLIIAQKRGYRIKEIPVRWTDDSDTRVHIIKTVIEDIKGLWRLSRSRPWKMS